MSEFLQSISLQNIHTIVSIIVTIIGAIIAIKTYLHAKETLLQPMRSAVVTKQTDILIDVTKKFGVDFPHIEAMMYFEVIQLTIFDTIEDITNVTLPTNEDKVNIVGKMALNKPHEMHSWYIASGQDTEEDIDKFFDSKDKRKKIKDGEYELDLLSYGEITSNIFGALSDYSNHPLVPEAIQEKLKKIEENCLSILKNELKNEVENYINSSMEKNKGTIYFDGIYNDFLRHNGGSKMERTEAYSLEINQEIRKYLHVDDEWK